MMIAALYRDYITCLKKIVPLIQLFFVGTFLSHKNIFKEQVLFYLTFI